MHLRRALLLFAIVLMVAGLAATLAPGDKAPGDSAKTRPAAPAPPAGEGAIRMAIDGRSGRPVRKAVQLGAHVILSVPVDSAGQVTVARLGLVQAAQPSTPASFDFIADQPGSIGVAFEPLEGNTEPLGSVVVEARR